MIHVGGEGTTTRREIASAHLAFLRDNCAHWLTYDFSKVHAELSYAEIEPGCGSFDIVFGPISRIADRSALLLLLLLLPLPHRVACSA